ncbi:MAG: hypothetical protein ABIJ09_02245 [Pseudomonadota bacterium]
MRTVVDQRYLDERARFDLRATCEHCEHFDTGHASCSLLFPVEPHREATHRRAAVGERVLFCKYFSID